MSKFVDVMLTTYFGLVVSFAILYIGILIILVIGTFIDKKERNDDIGA